MTDSTAATKTAKTGPAPRIPSNKTALRKLVGSRKPFTARELAEATEVTPVTAGKHIERLVEAGKVAEVGFRKTGKRGRPAREFVVTKGK